LHLVTDGAGVPLAAHLSAGQAHESNHLEPVLEAVRLKRAGPGRPRRRPKRLAGDQGYSHGRIRAYLRRRGIAAVIPRRADQRPADGRVKFDRDAYRRRNVGAAGIPGTAPVTPAGDPHAIVSITDNGFGYAVVTLAVPGSLVGVDLFTLIVTDYEGLVYQAAPTGDPAIVMLLHLNGNNVSYSGTVRSGTWAAVTRNVSTYVTDATIATPGWVTAIIEAWGQGGDGSSDTGGGGGAYAETQLHGQALGGTFYCAFDANPGSNGGGVLFWDGVTPYAFAGNGDPGGLGGAGGFATNADSTFGGGNGGTNVGGGGGAGGPNDYGNRGADGDGGTSFAAGGLYQGGGSTGGGSESEGDGGQFDPGNDSGDMGTGPGGGGSAHPTTPGTGAAGQVVVTSYTLT
jgi:Transposase DDE domain